jgi:hypothetical protein
VASSTQRKNPVVPRQGLSREYSIRGATPNQGLNGDELGICSSAQRVFLVSTSASRSLIRGTGGCVADPGWSPARGWHPRLEVASVRLRLPSYASCS